MNPSTVLLLLLSVVSLTLRAQPEKTYVTLDRSHYAAGDTIWVKGYVVEALHHTPRISSHTLHLALLDERGKPICQQALWLDSLAQAAGQIPLPDSLRAGTYQLLAYTERANTRDNHAVFRRPVQILARSGSMMTTKPPTYALRLLPEGGHLVAGLPARIAFQAHDSLDRSASVQGVVRSDLGDTLAQFFSVHRGRGFFMLTPQPGRRYVAVADINGQRVETALPAPRPTGRTLAVDNLTSAEAIRIIVHSNQLTAGRLTLFAHLRGTPSFQTEIPANKAEVRVAIPRTVVTENGVMVLTLLDETMTPVAERLVFVADRSPVSLSLTTQASYGPRQVVEMRVKVADSSGRPVATRLSVAVTDAGQDPETGAATLRSTLLLTSELRGYIEAPEEIFERSSGQTALRGDLLMLTHGWRHIKRSDSLHSATPASLPSLRFVGQALRPDGKPLSDESLSIMLKTRDKLTPLQARTDAGGRFLVEGGRFADTATAVVRSRFNRPLRVSLKAETPALPSFVFWPSDTLSAVEERVMLTKATDTQAFYRTLRERGAVQLNEVSVKARSTSINKDDSRRIFYGKADYTVEATEQMRTMPTVGQMIAGRVQGSGRCQGMAVMIDGVLTSSQSDALSTINPNDVEAIDIIVNPGTAGALSGFTGGCAMNILTRRGPDPKKPLQSAYVTLQGYVVAREFYSPNYATTDPPARPDRRATLYWNPSVQTDSNGEATVRFYNTDERTTIRIIAEGITPAGQPMLGRSQYIIRP
ncbi:MAG: hypothetical protein EAZ91_06375 [Cytophagales bacterium]|nr:MAG: hypothetical protein EAZ91_06375 [Cytophagales bacterium]